LPIIKNKQMQRREFLQKTSFSSLMLAGGAFPFAALETDDFLKLTILHTNDVHSRIDPFPMDGSKMQGLGGAAKRAALIKKIRAVEKNVLLLDAGDFFQGTPYFNYFGGELEIKLMSEMGYDAATLGNHDFDKGTDGLAKQMHHANFPFIICNYDLKNTELDQRTAPYKIFEKGGLKIGVTGVGINLDGLVPKSLFRETRYLDPVENANKIARQLRRDHGCHYVICLSHLGFENNDNKISDRIFVAQSEDIDLIIGGHSHTFMDKPAILKNKSGKSVLVNQVGWGGVILGRLDIYFEKSFKTFHTLFKSRKID